MFGTIRRHQTWLWIVIATITIVSFIVYFNPAAKSSRGARGPGSYGVINGHTITEGEMDDAGKEALLFYRLQGQRVDPNSPELTYAAYQNLFLAAKAEELGIQIPPEAASQFARRNILGPTKIEDFVN